MQRQPRDRPAQRATARQEHRKRKQSRRRLCVCGALAALCGGRLRRPAVARRRSRCVFVIFGYFVAAFTLRALRALRSNRAHDRSVTL